MRDAYPALSERPDWTYLDSAATTLLHRDVLQQVTQVLARGGSAGRAGHSAGAEATAGMRDARTSVARHFEVNANEVVFVRSATEGLNVVAQGWGRHNLLPGDRVLVSQLEHHSNALPWRAVARDTGAVVQTVPCDANGDLDLAALDALLLKQPRVFAVTHVSNVTGACVALHAVIAAVRRLAPDCLVVVDGTQAVSHLRPDLSALGADFYVFSGHKAYGPLGAGVVWGASHRWRQTRPVLWGGGMVSEVAAATESLAAAPACFEAGTPNHPAIVGLAAGLRHCSTTDDGLASQAAAALADIPGVRVLGAPKQRVGLVSWEHDGVHAHDVAAVLGEQGLAVRAGHLCAQPYVAHLGAQSAVRASFGRYNTPHDVERLISAVQRVRQALRGVA